MASYKDRLQFIAFFWGQLTSWSGRTGLGTCLLVLGACTSGQSLSEPKASHDTSTTSQRVQSSERATSRLPAELLGTFDVSQQACSASSMTRLSITPTKLNFYYGFANVNSVAFRDKGYDIDATLFQQEGQPKVVPEAVKYRIEPNGQGDLIQFANPWAGRKSSSMVRCLRSGQPSLESTKYKDAITPNKTVELVFASGASSRTVSDTISGFDFHDYLVRASANQTLKATLETKGSALVIVIENDGYRPDAVQSLSAKTQESITGVAGKSKGWLWEGTLPRDGVYRVRVIHSGPSANQASVSPYTLTVKIE
jgi:hypothetical protein